VNKPQAKSVLALLSAAFPREPMPDSTVELWSSAMLELEFDDARLAVSNIVSDMDRMPSLHQLKLACLSVKRDRLPELSAGGPSGPSLAAFLEANPEMRERVAKISNGPLRKETKVSERPKDMYEKIREVAQKLDRAQSDHPRKRRECAEHEFITHDRCYWCGAPAQTVQPEPV